VGFEEPGVYLVALTDDSGRPDAVLPAALVALNRLCTLLDGARNLRLTASG
jgi:hypothetical protein